MNFKLSNSSFWYSITPRMSLPFLLLLIATIVIEARPDLYSTLSVPKTATPKEITKAYRKLALKYHPDKSVPEIRAESEKKFKEIGHAHEILSDESKRKRYDLYGEKGLDDNFYPPGTNNGGGMNTNPFFGMGSSQGRSNKHSDPYGNQGPFFGGGIGGDGFQIDINEILQGFMDRRHPGGSPGSFGGNGRMGMGDGMGMNFGTSQQQQQQHPKYTNKSKPHIQPFHCTLAELSNINGSTKKLKVALPSSPSRTESIEKIYTINVQPGWKDGTKVKFKASKDGSFPPITFILREKKHKYFDRDGDDLIYRCNVTEKQAERGAKLKIPLPDGEVLEISTKPNEIMEGYEKKLVGKGMPTRRKRENGLYRGDFLIAFRIREKL